MISDHLKNYQMIQKSHFGIFTQKNWNKDLKKIAVLPCSLQQFTLANIWKQLKCPLKDDG